MKYLLLPVCLVLLHLHIAAQKFYFSVDSLRRDVAVLASDSLGGRGNFSYEIKLAARYIASQFKTHGLSYLEDEQSFIQPFTTPAHADNAFQLHLNGELVDKHFVYHTSLSLPVEPIEHYRKADLRHLTKEEVLQFTWAYADSTTAPTLFLLSRKSRSYSYLKRNSKKLPPTKYPFIFVEGDSEVNNIHLALNKNAASSLMENVVGVLPGRSKPGEIVFIGAHYDHLPRRTGKGDKVYNGANDNASGVAAMLAMMKYLAASKTNERTVIFIAFAGEEIGLIGSGYLASKLNTKGIKALFNLEMMGRTNGGGEATLMMVGHQYSNLLEIMRKNCESITIHTDEYPSQSLIVRSDHFPFLRLGVPAHTFMCFSPNDPHYHQVSDEVETLDMENFSLLVEGLMPGIEAVVSGQATPVFMPGK